MGYLGSSSHTNRNKLVAWAKTKQPRTAFDFGVGFGHFGMAVRKAMPDIVLDGCDGYPPAIAKHANLVGKPYDSVVLENISNTIRRIGEYDLFMFGDCLEHLQVDEAFEVLRIASNLAKYVIIRIPVGPHIKGERGIAGHPLERHLWTFYPSMLSRAQEWKCEYSLVSPCASRPDKHIKLEVVTDLDYHEQYELHQAHVGSYGLVRNE